MALKRPETLTAAGKILSVNHTTVALEVHRCWPPTKQCVVLAHHVDLT